MSQILGRIRIKNTRGKEILYTSDKSDLESFGLDPDIEFPDLKVIKKGTHLQIDEKEYQVKDMYTNFYEDTDENDESKGISLIGSGERNPFNFDITYYVEEI